MDIKIYEFILKSCFFFFNENKASPNFFIKETKLCFSQLRYCFENEGNFIFGNFLKTFEAS